MKAAAWLPSFAGRPAWRLAGYATVSAVVMLLAATGACGGDADVEPTASPASEPATGERTATPTPEVTRGAGGSLEIEIHLSESSGEYQTGMARLTAQGDETLVVVELVPSEPVAQPIHIHDGTCMEVGPVIHVLENVIDGMSETVVPEALGQIANGSTVINAHLSFADISTYTACGGIPVVE